MVSAAFKAFLMPTDSIDTALVLHRSGVFRRMGTHYMHRPKAVDHLMWMVLGGSGFVAEARRRVELATGDVCMLIPGVEHEYGSNPDDPWSVIWVHFGGRLAPAFAGRFRAFGKPASHLGLDPLVCQRFDELIRLHQQSGIASALRCNGELFNLLSLVLHRMHLRGLQSSNRPGIDTLALESYIDHRLPEAISLRDMAEHVHLSPAHFCRVFSRLYGQSPGRYVMGRRMRRAAMLLRETPDKIAEVGRQVGYADPYYFSRMFRKVMGQSPAAYRSGKGQIEELMRGPEMLMNWERPRR